MSKFVKQDLRNISFFKHGLHGFKRLPQIFFRFLFITINYLDCRIIIILTIEFSKPLSKTVFNSLHFSDKVINTNSCDWI